ncbi:uncharacterized protein LOC133867302 isoform X2 [Alnus glutinosa]|uniref:uncharacterized protein LOC133867302 isoform X2 n=1 Tax=Alnus glutinosa TaxID=3517 RepID=UPI002D764F32|nr:uncharacterized protein LOC133867302 isoform X2 [Alnus glutinosa]
MKTPEKLKREREAESPMEGRAKKRGNTGMDAALESKRGKRPVGFSEELVKEKVYGGDVGWIFIEVFSYSLLLYYILAQQEDDSSAASAVGPPNKVSLTLCTNSEFVDFVTQFQAQNPVGPLSGLRFKFCTNSEYVDAMSQFRAMDPAPQINEDVEIVFVPFEGGEQAASSGGGGGNGGGETHENILSQRPPHMTPSLLPVDNLPTQRHGKDDVDDIGLPTLAELQGTDEQSKKA